MSGQIHSAKTDNGNGYSQRCYACGCKTYTAYTAPSLSGRGLNLVMTCTGCGEGVSFLLG